MRLISWFLCLLKGTMVSHFNSHSKQKLFCVLFHREAPSDHLLDLTHLTRQDTHPNPINLQEQKKTYIYRENKLKEWRKRKEEENAFKSGKRRKATKWASRAPLGGQLPPPSFPLSAVFDACLRRRLAPNLRVWPKPTGSACLCWAARARSSGYLTSGLFPHLRPRFGASPREGDEGEGRRDGQEVLHQVEDAGALRIQLRPRHALHRPVGLPLSHPREALDLAMRFLCSWGPWILSGMLRFWASFSFRTVCSPIPSRSSWRSGLVERSYFIS